METEEEKQELKNRELRHLLEWEDHKAYMRLIKKYGAPKTEQEREDLMGRAEENVLRRKDVKKCINEYLGIQ